MNFIVSALNWAIKRKPQGTNYFVNNWIDYANEMGTPNRGCHKSVLKWFNHLNHLNHLIFLSRIEVEIPTPRVPWILRTEFAG